MKPNKGLSRKEVIKYVMSFVLVIAILLIFSILYGIFMPIFGLEEFPYSNYLLAGLSLIVTLLSSYFVAKYFNVNWLVLLIVLIIFNLILVYLT